MNAPFVAFILTTPPTVVKKAEKSTSPSTYSSYGLESKFQLVKYLLQTTEFVKRLTRINLS